MRVLVADKLAEEGLELLKSSGMQYDVKVGLKEDELAAEVANYDALIVRSGAKATAKVLANPGKLRAIARAGVGVDNIDCEAATLKGILVMNTAEASTLSTAEHALALMMSLARKIPQAHNALRSGQLEWKKRSVYQGTQLAGKTLGIFSMGYLGERLGFPLPDGMIFKDLLIAGLIAAIGFTVALFVAGEAFTDPVLQGAAKMGAMLSIGFIPLAWGLARLAGIRKKG